MDDYSLVLDNEDDDVIVSDENDGLAQLHQLEEESYACASLAASAEWSMWLALARIREEGLWTYEAEEGDTFKDYLANWLHEVKRRLAEQAKAKGEIAPAFGAGISLAMKKLTIYRRLVSHFDVPPQLALAAPIDVMTTFMATLAPKWNYKTGVPLDIEPYADDGLSKEFPDEPTFDDRVRRAVQVICAITNPGDAKDYIKEKFGPPQEEKTEYRFVVVVIRGGPQDGVPFIRAKATTVNDGDGEVIDAPIYDWNGPWPDEALTALAKKLDAIVQEVEVGVHTRQDQSE